MYGRQQEIWQGIQVIATAVEGNEYGVGDYLAEAHIAEALEALAKTVRGYRRADEKRAREWAACRKAEVAVP